MKCENCNAKISYKKEKYVNTKIVCEYCFKKLKGRTSRKACIRDDYLTWLTLSKKFKKVD